MSVAHESPALGGPRRARASRKGGEAGAVAACALVALVASVTGCTQDGEDPRDVAGDEEVSSGSLASTFDCASAFGLIGAASYMTGEIVVPSGDVEAVATTPSGSPAINCTTGSSVTINWEPIKIEVPVSGGLTGKILLQNFVVIGTPGALLPGECVPPTPCHPGTVDPMCADDTELLEFDTRVCTVAAFAAGTCQLWAAKAQICGAV